VKSSYVHRRISSVNNVASPISLRLIGLTQHSVYQCKVTQTRWNYFMANLYKWDFSTFLNSFIFGKYSFALFIRFWGQCCNTLLSGDRFRDLVMWSSMSLSLLPCLTLSARAKTQLSSLYALNWFCVCEDISLSDFRNAGWKWIKPHFCKMSICHTWPWCHTVGNVGLRICIDITDFNISFQSNSIYVTHVQYIYMVYVRYNLSRYMFNTS
jgi:hypothetical protein